LFLSGMEQESVGFIVPSIGSLVARAGLRTMPAHYPSSVNSICFPPQQDTPV